MKIVTLSGWLGGFGENPQDPTWSLEERGVPVSHKFEIRRSRYFVEGTKLLINDSVRMEGDFIPDGYVYKHTDRWNGFEFRPDTVSRRDPGFIYVYIRTQDFVPGVVAEAFYKRPVYEDTPYKLGIRQIWQLNSGESLIIRWCGYYWKVSNFSRNILIEEFFRDGKRRVLVGNLERAPIEIQEIYAMQELRFLETRYAAVCRRLGRRGAPTSRYCRIGCGQYGDPLPP